MPTLPSGRPPTPGTIPDLTTPQARAVAESFGVDAERYDRARPRYPAALVGRIVAAAPGPAVLDVGCGTGIVARQFQAAGCRVLGVEPDARMADFARRHGVEVEAARFEDWEADGRMFDAVVAGTAWHWIDPVAGAASAARVLRAGGLLAPFWHVFQLPPEVARAFAAAYHRVAPESPVAPQPDRQGPEAYQPVVTRAAEGIREAGGFGIPEQWRFDGERILTRDELLDLMPTQGHLTRLPQEPLAEVLASVGDAVDAHGGSVTIPLTTLALAAVRLAA